MGAGEGARGLVCEYREGTPSPTSSTRHTDSGERCIFISTLSSPHLIAGYLPVAPGSGSL